MISIRSKRNLELTHYQHLDNLLATCNCHRRRRPNGRDFREAGKWRSVQDCRIPRVLVNNVTFKAETLISKSKLFAGEKFQFTLVIRCMARGNWKLSRESPRRAWKWPGHSTALDGQWLSAKCPLTGFCVSLSNWSTVQAYSLPICRIFQLLICIEYIGFPATM